MPEHDLVVIGAGVAGLTAAMIAAQHGLKVVVVDRMGVGGQIATAERIANLPGFPQGIAGHELGPLLHEHAESAGAEFTLDTVETIEVEGDARLVRGAAESYLARAVIIAAGSAHRALGIRGEEEFLGLGVSHCASCDGPLFAGQPVAVIGGGDSALDEALVLAEHAARVTVIHRGDALRAQQSLVSKARGHPKLAIMPATVVEAIVGEAAVTGLRLQDNRTATTRVEEIKGVFICVGLEPNSAFLRGVLALDPMGHIETDAMMRTSLAGVFAAGDIRKHSVALLAAAAGDGATAAVSAARYLKTR